MKIAYVVVSFPSITESFVIREIKHLAHLLPEGLPLICAYKKPSSGWRNKENAELIEHTIYLRRRWFHNLRSFLFFIFARPSTVADLIIVWISELGRLKIGDAIRSILHLLSGFGLAKIVKDNKITHLHSHFSTASTIAFTASRLSGISFSFTAHASGDIYVYSPFLLEKIKWATKIIAISEYNKNYLKLISNYTVHESKIEVIYNGVDIPQRSCSERPFAKDTPIIFMSAAFTGFKGYMTLMRALKLVKESGSQFVFLAAGGGPFFDVIKDTVCKLSLTEHVKLLGFVGLSEVERLLSMTDLFVFPAEIFMNGQRDGMPTAITEAMSYGLPIVSTYVSGIPEQVIDGVNGYLVPERDEERLASKIIELLADVGLRREMGNKSYEIALSRFNIKKNIQRLHQVFTQLSTARN